MTEGAEWSDVNEHAREQWKDETTPFGGFPPLLEEGASALAISLCGAGR